MSDPFRTIRPGEPIGSKHPLFSATRHNAVTALVDPSRQGAVPSPGPEIGGGGVASTPGTAETRVRVYDDLTPSQTVRCLPISSANAEVGDTAAEFIDATPLESTTLTLANSSCNDSGGSVAPSGLRINSIGRIDASEDDAVVVSGAGVANNSSVAVSISDGTTTKTAGSVTVSSDGSWTAAAIDLTASTALVRGVLKVTAQETTNDAEVLRARSLGVAYESVASPSPSIPPKALTPDLVAASDTGDSDTDNVTTDTTPTFLATLPAGTGTDALGPAPYLVVDGEVEVSGAFNDLDDGSQEQTCVTTLANGGHSAQIVLATIDNGATPSGAYFGEASDPLYFTIDPTASGPAAAPATRVNRAGIVFDFGGVKVLGILGACVIENTTAENTKLDA